MNHDKKMFEGNCKFPSSAGHHRPKVIKSEVMCFAKYTLRSWRFQSYWWFLFFEINFFYDTPLRTNFWKEARLVTNAADWSKTRHTHTLLFSSHTILSLFLFFIPCLKKMSAY